MNEEARSSSTESLFELWWQNVSGYPLFSNECTKETQKRGRRDSGGLVVVRATRARSLRLCKVNCGASCLVGARTHKFSPLRQMPEQNTSKTPTKRSSARILGFSEVHAMLPSFPGRLCCCLIHADTAIIVQLANLSVLLLLQYGGKLLRAVGFSLTRCHSRTITRSIRCRNQTIFLLLVERGTTVSIDCSANRPATRFTYTPTQSQHNLVRHGTAAPHRSGTQDCSHKTAANTVILKLTLVVLGVDCMTMRLGERHLEPCRGESAWTKSCARSSMALPTVAGKDG